MLVQYQWNPYHLSRNFGDETEDPDFSEIHSLDLSEVVPSLSGPKRPHDRVSVSSMKEDFKNCLVSPVGFKVHLLHFEYLMARPITI